ncbi:MAG: methylmalonyl-CoA/ethylmalonyl-CoA epimerase [Thermotogaceae bacterium]|nr:methylmalonyl-CoA/ethylmalonyl-CoA epimerase [Thermotogaceae bacterium]
MSVTKIDHIGIAVKSIDESLKLYKDVLDMDFKGIEEMTDRALKTAFIQAGDSMIELLEPTSEKSTIAKFLDKKGQGIHHIALHVENIQETMESLKEKGYRLLSEEPEKGAHGTKVAFLHPKSTNGVLLELVEVDH